MLNVVVHIVTTRLQWGNISEQLSQLNNITYKIRCVLYYF